MTEFIQWLNMHGYAGYVWPAYGLVAAVLAINVARIRVKHKRFWHRMR